MVLGLDNRPIFKQKKNQIKASNLPPSGWPPFGFFPPQLAEIYGFPEGGFGAGQTIGIIELTIDIPGYTQGYGPDIYSYFDQIGIPRPTITDVSVDGATNAGSIFAIKDRGTGTTLLRFMHFNTLFGFIYQIFFQIYYDFIEIWSTWN